MWLSKLMRGGQYASMTSFFASNFIFLFLLTFVVLFLLTPKKYKRYTLLVSSYAYYWLISGIGLAFLLLATLSMYSFGIWLDKLTKKHKALVKAADKADKKALKAGLKKRRQYVVALGILAHIGLLVVLKYTPFITQNINSLSAMLGWPLQLTIVKYSVPIGLSFFSMQMVAYLVDVFRGTIQADYNLVRVALFASYFPQIVEGPISRYQETAQQIYDVQPMQWTNFLHGAQRFLYGAFKKIVIADRLNVFIKLIYNQYPEYEGSLVFMVAIAYTIQLYMEFSGSMDAVIGMSEMLGIRVPENFRHPFFSRTISEFWQRWHITLGTWFRDYIFYPVTLSKAMKKVTNWARKTIGATYGPYIASAVALLCVWLGNGLWHGPAWQYVFFGLYHFVFILIETLMGPIMKKIGSKVNLHSPWYQGYQIVRTMIIVFIGEMFFRAPSLDQGLAMFKHMVTNFSFSTWTPDLIAKIGIDVYDIAVIVIGCAIVLTISILQENGVAVRNKIESSPIVLRWAFWYAVILVIVILGAYGGNYIPLDPIYANF